MGELVGDLDLPEFDIADSGLAGDAYHDRLAAVREHGWLVKSPIAYVVLDREAGEFFLRARQTAFPGREIAELFGISGGRLAEQIDANILNLTGDRHRRLRALVAPAFTPRAAARWRPVMREIAACALAGAGGPVRVRVRVLVRRPVPGAHDRRGHRRAAAGRGGTARVVEPGAAAVRHPGARRRARADRAGRLRAVRLRRGPA